MTKAISELVTDLATGRTTSRVLVESCLARIEDKNRDVAAFVSVDVNGARAAADAMDSLRASGMAPSPLAGIPVSIKDLFDVQGQVTTAGSVVLKDMPPASRDAPAIARLREAGMILIGRTNMSEFAFSGVGLNLHYGTPWNPADKDNHRIPGGSSSGAAVSVAADMVPVGIGSDTGGSCRIPAAYCGIVGYKPSQQRVSRDKVFPLSKSLDSIGPLANTVDCCALIDGLMAGLPVMDNVGKSPAHFRLAVPQTLVFDETDSVVASAFDRAIRTLADAGVKIEEIPLPELGRIPGLYKNGGIATAEALAVHRNRLSTQENLYDPRIAARIRQGEKVSAADYIDIKEARTAMIQDVASITAPYDALIMPAVPIVAPLVSELESDEGYLHFNRLSLRNTMLGNFLDACGISLPCHRQEELPVGLMLMAGNGADDSLFKVARTVEKLLGSDQ